MEEKQTPLYDTSLFAEIYKAIETSKKDTILAEFTAKIAQDILLHKT